MSAFIRCLKLLCPFFAILIVQQSASLLYGDDKVSSSTQDAGIKFDLDALSKPPEVFEADDSARCTNFTSGHGTMARYSSKQTRSHD